VVASVEIHPKISPNQTNGTKFPYFVKGLCKLQTGWRQMVDGNMQMVKCG